jgi:anti-anti-sigma factor
MNEALSIDLLPVGGEQARVFSLKGPLTLTTFFPFQAAMRQETAPTVIVEMSGVPYVDSAGLGVLVNSFVSCEKHGRHFLLAGVPKRVKDLLAMTKVSQLFPDYATWEDALNRKAAG